MNCVKLISIFILLRWEIPTKAIFDLFQLEEYKNISNCHYETVKQISVFIRYYLLVLGAPFLIFNLIFTKNESLKSFYAGTDAYYLL